MCSALVTDVYFFFPKFDHLFSGYLKRFLNAKVRLRGRQAKVFGFSHAFKNIFLKLITAPKFRFSLLFGLVWLLYTKQAHYNEGCAKLNYLLPEV